MPFAAKRWSLLPYLIIAVANIAFEYIPNYEGTALTKALLMPMLLLYLWQNVPTKPLLIIFALFFSWLGDIFLLKSSIPLRFMMGLGAFLIAHIFYIAFFVREIKMARQPFYKHHFWAILLIWVAMMCLLMPNTTSFSAPVALYATVILTMLYLALTRRSVVAYASFIWVATGAGLFVLSDSMIAINKFVIPLPLARILIMTTYLFGQGAIVYGIIRKG